MRYTLLFSILILFFISCSKDKFSSTPSLKFESVNTRGLHNQEAIRFTLSFTDAEGDISDSMYVQTIAANCTASNNFSFFKVPSFPSTKNQKGTINVTLNYTDISPKCQENDTTVFRFVLKDLANHVSDTVSSPTIILYYP